PQRKNENQVLRRLDGGLCSVNARRRRRVTLPSLSRAKHREVQRSDVDNVHLVSLRAGTVAVGLRQSATKPARIGIGMALNDDDSRHGELSFEGFQKGDEITNLVRLEAKLRHVRMTGDDALAERFLQRLHWITQMQRAKRRRELERARAHLVDRVTARTIGARQCPAALLCG